MTHATDTTPLRLTRADRLKLWERLGDLIERYLDEVASPPVRPTMNPAAVREHLEGFEIGIRHDPCDVLERVYEGMRQFQLHTAHPRYFGLFNPSPATMGIAADTLVALFNPQLAAWARHGSRRSGSARNRPLRSGPASPTSRRRTPIFAVWSADSAKLASMNRTRPVRDVQWPVPREATPGH